MPESIINLVTKKTERKIDTQNQPDNLIELD